MVVRVAGKHLGGWPHPLSGRPPAVSLLSQWCAASRPARGKPCAGHLFQENNILSVAVQFGQPPRAIGRECTPPSLDRPAGRSAEGSNTVGQTNQAGSHSSPGRRITGSRQRPAASAWYGPSGVVRVPRPGVRTCRPTCGPDHTQSLEAGQWQSGWGARPFWRQPREAVEHEGVERAGVAHTGDAQSGRAQLRMDRRGGYPKREHEQPSTADAPNRPPRPGLCICCTATETAALC